MLISANWPAIARRWSRRDYIRLLVFRQGGFSMPESQAKFRFWWFFFSLKGRVTRVPFAVFLLSTRLALEAGSFIITQAVSNDNIPLKSGLYLFLGLIGIVLLWPQFSVLTKRLHDISLPFWPALLYFVPKASQLAFLYFWQAQSRINALATPTSAEVQFNIWASMLIPALNVGVWIGLLVLAFIPGTQGRNRYGPHPHRPDQSASEVF